MSYVAESVGEEIWENVEPNGYSLSSGSSAPDAVSCPHVTGMLLLGFRDGGMTNEIFAIFEMPHNYKPGTAIKPHIHWMADTNEIADVKWQLSYSIGDDNVEFTAEQTIVAIQATNGADKYLSKEFTPAITNSALNGGAIVMMRLFRDATDPQDTYTGTAKLLSFGIHYQSKVVGSKSVFVSG